MARLLVGHCESKGCGMRIYRGEQVWKYGHRMFCHIQCLVDCTKKTALDGGKRKIKGCPYYNRGTGGTQYA